MLTLIRTPIFYEVTLLSVSLPVADKKGTDADPLFTSLF